MGADLVLEMTIADDFALVEEQREFLNRYQRFVEGEKTALPMLASTCPGGSIMFISFLIGIFSFQDKIIFV